MIAQLAEFRDEQLQVWPLARENYNALGATRRRQFHIGALEGALQFNPARAVSTGARIDSEAVKARPCFLCESNRPPEQVSEEILPGWDFLVNPFPIFPLHFTIADKNHSPQEHIPVEMAAMAEKLPGMTVFFNGAKAGASAPDHRHCQAVMTSELPLMRFLEQGGNPEALPFKVDYRVITPDPKGMTLLADIPSLKGRDIKDGSPDHRLLNAFMWIGNDGLLRSCVVFRQAHRPCCYADGDKSGYMVSPGAIDMAGIIVLPRLPDFETLSDSEIEKIYSEVALPV